MKAYLTQLFEYDKWANHQLLARFEKQFPQNERIYELFSHLLSAQRNWLDRLLGVPQTAVLWGQRLPAELRADVDNYNDAWIMYIEQLSDEAFKGSIHYTNSKGDSFDNTVVDIITHVINHGTHHRGEILILMKEEGFVLPNIDFITYVR